MVLSQLNFSSNSKQDVFTDTRPLQRIPRLFLYTNMEKKKMEKTKGNFLNRIRHNYFLSPSMTPVQPQAETQRLAQMKLSPQC